MKERGCLIIKWLSSVGRVLIVLDHVGGKDYMVVKGEWL